MSARFIDLCHRDSIQVNETVELFYPAWPVHCQPDLAPHVTALMHSHAELARVEHSSSFCAQGRVKSGPMQLTNW